MSIQGILSSRKTSGLRLICQTFQSCKAWVQIRLTAPVLRLRSVCPTGQRLCRERWQAIPILSRLHQHHAKDSCPPLDRCRGAPFRMYH